MIHREHIEWRDIWVTGADDGTLPRLLLVGDSIAHSYFNQVETELSGIFLCARMTSSTCVCDTAIDREMALLLDDYRFDVIHFNNGLHGWDYDESAYAVGLCRGLDFITERSPGSRLICATSTPVRRRDNPSEFDPRTARVRERNRIMRDLAVQRGLEVDDLFGCVADHPQYTSKDGVHFNPDGQSALGKQVARIVLAERHRNAEQPSAGDVATRTEKG